MCRCDTPLPQRETGCDGLLDTSGSKAWVGSLTAAPIPGATPLVAGCSHSGLNFREESAPILERRSNALGHGHMGKVGLCELPRNLP
jgi:hypothetical protein